LIFQETKLKTIDNSGAKKVQCIKVLNKKNIGYPGDILVTTIKYAVSKKFRSKRKSLRNGEIHKVLLAYTKKGVYRKTGLFLCAPDNKVIILRKENPTLPFANRIKVPIFYECRKASAKIFLIAPDIF
jgi:large subunit ribosomal protein L14